MHRVVAVFVASTVLLSLAAAASAQVTFLNTFGQAGDARVGFQRIGVTRGTGNFAYWDTEVILANLNRINNVSSVTVMTPFGPTKDANAFLRDPYLNTGIGDIGVGNGTSFGATDQWTQITFDKPIINSAGPDGFIAGLQFLWVTPNYSPMIISTSANNSYVFPTSGGFNGSETDPLAQYTYLSTVATPADLIAFTPQNSGSLIRPSYVIQTFDLSSMGVPLGGSVSSLYLQDWSGNGNGVIPTYVAGFPAVPEPAGLGLLAVGALALVRRRAM